MNRWIVRTVFGLISILLIVGSAASFMLLPALGQDRWLVIAIIALAGLFVLAKLVEIFLSVKAGKEPE